MTGKACTSGFMHTMNVLLGVNQIKTVLKTHFCHGIVKLSIEHASLYVRDLSLTRALLCDNLRSTWFRDEILTVRNIS